MLASVAIAGTGCSDDDDFDEGSLRVTNLSDFTITELFLTEIDNPDFGPNLLAGDVLLPGEEITIGVSCDIFDAMLVDEAGVECHIDAIDLCDNDADWVIRNNTCTVFEAAAKAREAQQADPNAAKDASAK